MQHPVTDTGPSGLYWVEKEQIVSAPVPLMTGTTLSHNSGIPASMDNPVSCAQADDNGSMSSIPSSYKPQLGLGHDSCHPVLEIPVE